MVVQYLLPESSKLSVLPRGVDKGVGIRTSLEGLLMRDWAGDERDIPGNTQSPIT